jgi:PAS domain S-box-containing protein
MRQKQRLYWLMAILAAVTIAVAGISNYILYQKAIAGQRERLVDTVGNLAQLIGSVARMDPSLRGSDTEILLRATLERIQPSQFRGLGKTGEIVLAKQQGDSILFLTNRRYGISDKIGPISLKSRYAEPMRLALSGKAGTVVGPDYRGEKVLAAYEYIPLLKLGIDAKIDFSEIRAPYVKSAAVSGTIAAMAILAGFFLFGRLTNPILAALEASEKQYRTLIETLQEGVWAIDQDAKTTFVNPKMAAMLGYTIEEMTGKSLFSFMDQDGIASAKDKMEMRKKGVREQHDFEFLRKDGRRISVTLETAPILDEQGRFGGALAGVMDVTERRRADAALKISEEKFRSIIEQSADGIVLTDPEGILIEWNRGAERIMGLRRRDILGQPLWSVQLRMAPADKRTPEDAEKLKAVLMSFFRTQQAPWLNRLIETGIERPDGARRTIQTLVFFIQTQSGPLVCGIFRDVTELKQTEEKLKSLVQEKETLLKEVFHRVKNNFQIVSSLLNLQSHSLKNPQALSVLQESRDRIRTMSLIHEKLYRSESLTGVRFDEYLRELAAGLFDSYGADPFKIGLKVEAKEVLLGMDMAVPTGLIVNELVSNSLKHAFPPEQTKKGLVSIRLAREKNGTVRLSVADNGRGLPEDLDVRHTESLGLHLVTMLAQDQLNGKLKLERKNGTKFTIEFRERA